MLALVLVLLAADAAVAPPDAGAPPADAGPPAAKGPPPTFEQSCLPETVHIGDTITCTLKITHAGDVSVSVTAPPSLEAAEAGPATPIDGGKLLSTRVFTQQVRGMKPVKIEGLQVVWDEAEGGRGSVPVPGVKIPVASVLSDAQDPKFRTLAEPAPDDPGPFWLRRGPVPWRVTSWPAVIAVGALLVVALGVGIGVLVKRHLDARAIEEVPWVDPRPAHVIAYELLDELAKADLPGKGQVMQYYVVLSEIVRDYLERRFGFTAPEMTSHEIRERVEGLELGSDARLGIDDFLNETDLVKFADFAPSDSEIDTVMKLARGLVASTLAGEEEAPA